MNGYFEDYSDFRVEICYNDTLTVGFLKFSEIKSSSTRLFLVNSCILLINQSILSIFRMIGPLCTYTLASKRVFHKTSKAERYRETVVTCFLCRF